MSRFDHANIIIGALFVLFILAMAFGPIHRRKPAAAPAVSHDPAAVLSFHPGAYRNKRSGGYRPVVRVFRNGKPIGSKAAPVAWAATAEEAEAFARCQALRVALNMPEAGIIVR